MKPPSSSSNWLIGFKSSLSSACSSVAGADACAGAGAAAGDGAACAAGGGIIAYAMADVDGCGDAARCAAAEVLGCGSIDSSAIATSSCRSADVDGVGGAGIELPALRRIFRGGLILLQSTRF